MNKMITNGFDINKSLYRFKCINCGKRLWIGFGDIPPECDCDEQEHEKLFDEAKKYGYLVKVCSGCGRIPDSPGCGCPAGTKFVWERFVKDKLQSEYKAVCNNDYVMTEEDKNKIMELGLNKSQSTGDKYGETFADIKLENIKTSADNKLSWNTADMVAPIPDIIREPLNKNMELIKGIVDLFSCIIAYVTPSINATELIKKSHDNLFKKFTELKNSLDNL